MVIREITNPEEKAANFANAILVAAEKARELESIREYIRPEKKSRKQHELLNDGSR